MCDSAREAPKPLTIVRGMAAPVNAGLLCRLTADTEEGECVVPLLDARPSCPPDLVSIR